MPKEVKYAQQRANEVVLKTREMLHSMPQTCAGYLLSIEPRTTPLTRYVYLCSLKIFFEYLTRENPFFADKQIRLFTPADLESITVADITMYLEYLTLYMKDDDSVVTNGDASRMTKMIAVRGYFGYLFKNNLLSKDVTRAVDIPRRREKPILRMELDEVARMLDLVESENAFGEDSRQSRYNEHTRKRDFAILTLFLGTGIRVSELVGLDINDIDFNVNGFLVTRKGQKMTVLYFSDEVSDILKDYLEYRNQQSPLPGHENALFLSLQNKRMSVRAVENMVKKYATLASPLKRRLSPHKLRSTFGTNLYNETGDIYLVADVLGHSDVNTTRKHYADMTDERRRMAAKSVKIRDKK